MYQSKVKLLKIGCALLALLTVLAMFAACSKTPTTDTDSTPTEDKTAKDPVPHYNWKERRFDVLAVNNSNEPNIEITGAINGNVLSQAAFKRNEWIEDYYNVEIKQQNISSAENSYDKLNIIQQAGDHNYDLVFLARNNMATAITAGLMTDLTTLKYLDFSNEWYNESTLESMKIGEKLYHMVSDFSLVDKARTNVLYYNKDLGAQYDLPDLVQMVKDGTWTVEEMAKYTKAYNTDGGESSDLDVNDTWGLVLGGEEGYAAFWNATENKTISFDNDGKYSVTVANEHSISSIEKLTKLFKEDVAFSGSKVKRDGKVDKDYSAPSNTFIAGRAFFMSNCLSSIINIGNNATFSYTVLPYPKYDSNQKQYYTTNDNSCGATFGIPGTAAEPEFSAFMVEVLSWKSSTTTFPAYYQTICKVRSTYDKECADMLDFVLSGLTFDFGLMYGTGDSKLKTGILLPVLQDSTISISTEYAKVQESCETYLDNLFTTIEGFGKE